MTCDQQRSLPQLAALDGRLSLDEATISNSYVQTDIGRIRKCRTSKLRCREHCRGCGHECLADTKFEGICVVGTWPPNPQPDQRPPPHHIHRQDAPAHGTPPLPWHKVVPTQGDFLASSHGDVLNPLKSQKVEVQRSLGDVTGSSSPPRSASHMQPPIRVQKKNGATTRPRVGGAPAPGLIMIGKGCNWRAF